MTSGGSLRVLALATAAVVNGCTGQVDTIVDRAGNEWVPGSFTYQQLARKTQQNLEGRHLVEQGESSTKVEPDAVNTRISFEADLAITTESTNHVGDLDFVADALSNNRGKFIVTIEIPEGSPLASASLDDAELMTDDQLRRAGVKHNFNQKLGVEVPGSLAAPGTHFPAALFACVDTNRNGRCADEIVERLNRWRPQQNVVFFAGLEGVVQGEGDGRTVEFERASAEEIGSTNWIMTEVLENLPSANTDQPLTATLAVGAVGDEIVGFARRPDKYITPTELAEIKQEIQQQQMRAQFGKRTSGCFVSGTRVALDQSRIDVVEHVFKGVTVLTEDGKRKVLRAVRGPENLPIVEIGTERGYRIRVTQRHPMLTPTGLTMAGQLKLGDKLIAAEDRGEVAITSLRKMPYDGLVYNFSLPGADDDDHLVAAEGLITGDLYLQQKLSSSRGLIENKRSTLQPAPK